jgi:hypothetical protein
MKRVIFILTCLVMLLRCASAGSETESQNWVCPDPNGFRGIGWGQGLENLTNLKSIGPLDFSKYEDVFDKIGEHPAFYFLQKWSGTGYVNEKDNLNIGYADVKEILYLFREDRFYGVVIESLGSVNRNELEKAIGAWIGNPTARLTIGNNHVVIWERCRIRVVLDFNRTILASKRDIKLYIISKDMEAHFIGF